MKKGLLTLATCVMAFSLVVGCGSKSNTGTTNTGAAKSDIKAGMVTDAGTIDDKSFNQGTWEGVLRAGKEFGLETKYLRPAGTTEADYLKEMGNLYDAGYKIIFAPGFKFETAIFAAQTKYKDAKFVIIDGTPHSAEKGAKPDVKENSVSIFFSEHESGFIAGVATALQLKEAEAGFIGGMEIPAVQKYNWGFQQGLKYANDNLGTKISLKKENDVYQGTFNDSAAGGQLAAQMYDRGVNVIFTAAGGVGVGAINEAKTRATAGKNVWIVGVDVDQYADGIYKDDKSIILTSAMKKIDQASFDMVKALKDGTFPGGKTLTFDVKNDGVGIPDKNPNLNDETVTKVKEIVAKLKSDEIKVAAEQGTLLK
ncbi:BMP family ABC transporter substrate-binding protein [Paenibacillus baekrokdamisoli]|uniref:BMP family ABC transporter substrate-binding protein n=1 Tax=Paenibacillus baekrokdamisoli TaxID=1712516 RepID=A0A3G9JGM8_9BACL|nr:BMP family ABC transporter substrate-binding protein [Paenibacillus baekrokdamisoli]MBB3070806.1 basic membrane protein A [Paenibacillus baekrokdamisoli]BBH22254.1 BMP family ABC transporter substrate-binding protein [Paenibacillus baekrokdamisoli]